jgi:hypothetical protein
MMGNAQAGIQISKKDKPLTPHPACVNIQTTVILGFDGCLESTGYFNLSLINQRRINLAILIVYAHSATEF